MNNSTSEAYLANIAEHIILQIVNYEKEQHDYIFKNMLNSNKIFIKNYQEKLNKIPIDLDQKVEDKFIELQRNIEFNNVEKSKKFCREYVRKILIKEYTDYITIECNKTWNDELIRSLNIKPITTRSNDVYVNFYHHNNIILVPSYLDSDKNFHYFCSYCGMTKTNYKIIKLLNNSTLLTKKENKERKRTMKDDEDNYNIEEDDEKKHIPNGNYYKYKDMNHCIEAYTGKASNLITIDIDYAFLCCNLFIECFKTSLCTLTKNGFHFHYLYDDKLRASKVFKYDYGFDIKNYTVVRMPPSYYYYEHNGVLSFDKFKYLFFRFNNQT